MPDAERLVSLADFINIWEPRALWGAKKLSAIVGEAGGRPPTLFPVTIHPQPRARVWYPENSGFTGGRGLSSVGVSLYPPGGPQQQRDQEPPGGAWSREHKQPSSEHV